MRERLLKLLRLLADAVSLRDVLCAAGLGCVGYGLGQVYEPAAWCVVGATLFWLAVIWRPRGPS